MTTDVPIRPLQIKHRAFSPGRIIAIASNTLLELVRLKVFYILLIFAVLIIGCSGLTSLINFVYQEEFQILKDLALGAMSIFTILLSVLATAMVLPKDIEDRTLYTILAKPVPRFEYLMGKLLGVFALLGISVVVMTAMFAVALWLKQESLIGDAMKGAAGMKPADVQAMVGTIKSHAFTTSLIPCILTIYLKAALFASLTLLISTFASSTIFTIFVAFTAYFIGNVEWILREYASQPGTGELTKGFALLVALFFPDLQLFNLVDDIVAGNTIAMVLFVKTAGLGMVYITVYSFVAYLIFAFKEL